MAAGAELFLDPARAVRRLRLFLIATGLLLATPVAFLLLRAYSQLEAETRIGSARAAEEVGAQLDRQLLELLRPEEERAVEDYAFLRAGPGGAAELSPLARERGAGGFPGLLAHFQIDAAGRLSSPLLPADDQDPQLLSRGFSSGEISERRRLLARMHALVSATKIPSLREARMAPVRREEKKSSLLPAQAKQASRSLEQRAPRRSVVSALSDLVSSGSLDSVSEKSVTSYSTESPRKKAAGPAPAPGGLSQSAEPAREAGDSASRATLAESAAPGTHFPAAGSATGFGEAGREAGAGPAAGPEPDRARPGHNEIPMAPLPISRFVAEIEPFQAIPEGEHTLFFRRVLREDQRTVQGFLVSTEALLLSLAEASFLTSALSQEAGLEFRRGELILGSFLPAGPYQDASVFSRGGASGLPHEIARLHAAPPLDSLELVFRVPSLRPVRGGLILHLLSAVIVLVLSGGLLLVYRLSVSQIRFAAERSDFVSAVSHELRTPLTSIRMYAEMLRGGMAGDEAKRNSYYDFILSESERLSRLIGNVLQFAKLSKGIAAPPLRSFRTGTLLDLARSKLASQVQAAGFELLIRNSAEEAEVQAEEDAFTQIFINLVDNALKFSAASQRRCIELGAREEAGGRRICFFVRDFGPGIPKEEQKKIFRLFYRSENELTRKTSGTGIGLALVRQLALSIGAELDLASPEGGGSEFRLHVRRL